MVDHKFSNTNVKNCGDNLATGVYKNSRLMHSVTSLIGCLVEVELGNGERHEGIFKTFSPDFEVVLFSAARIINDTPDKLASMQGSNVNNLVSVLGKPNCEEFFTEKLVVGIQDMVKITALNVDLDYATMTKKSVLTDGEISKVDNKKIMERELVPWDDDGANNTFETLEENSNNVSNGWSTEDMFQLNERKYNIHSTFKEDMSDYTIPLNKRDDDDYVQKQERAELIARDIEKDAVRQRRLAKENELDEETRFSAVVSSKRDEPSSLHSNISSPRSEVSHSSSSRNDRPREPLRNNPDAGFRTQRSRRTRGSDHSDRSDRGSVRDHGDRGSVRDHGDRGSVRDRPGNRNSGVNENWRDPGRMNSSRQFNNTVQPTVTYSNSAYNNSAKSGGNPPNTFVPQKYAPSGTNVPQNQYTSSSGPKSSYSAVSARHATNEHMVHENDSKSYPNRGHSNIKPAPSSVPTPSNEPSQTMNHHHQQQQKQQPPSQPQQQQPQQQKAPSPAKSEQSANQQPVTKGKLIDDNNNLPASRKVAEPKKADQPVGQTAPSTATPPSSEVAKPEIELKKESSPPVPSIASPVAPVVAAATTASQPSPAASVSASVSAEDTSTHTTSTSTAPSNEIVKTSKLNPDAKSFTPGGFRPALAAPQQQQQQQPPPPPQQQYIPQNPVTMSYQYQAQHLSTTPPSAPMQGQFIQIHPSQLPPQNIHHSQPQAHQLNRNNPYATMYNFIAPQMVPGQYLIPNVPGMPNAIPQHGVYASQVAAGIPAQATSAQAAGPNQGGPGGQIPAHMLVSNAGPPVVNQPPQGVQSRGPYRGKGGSNHGPGPNQQSQQYMRTHHMDYNQQSQVASVTGQPIMATHSANASMQVAYSTAGPMHGSHAPHQHGQPPQNLAAAQMAPQQGPQQAMQYAMYNPNVFPGRPPMALIPQGQLNMAMYAPEHQQMNMMIGCTDCPQPMQMANPNVPGVVPQTNPNLQQSSAPSIPSSAPSNTPNANLVSQGAPPPQAY